MAFLTIAGTNYDVQTTGASEAAPRLVGKVVPTHAGGLRSTRRARKRVFQFTLAPLTVAAYEALVTAVALDPVTVTGDAVNGATFSAIVDVNSGVFLDDLTQTRFHQRVAQVTISEA